MTTKNMTVPDIGGAAEIDVIEILVKVGDHIKVDTPLVTLESDKATMEVPSTAAGVVKELRVKVGDKVTTGSVMLVLEEETGATTQAAKPSSTEATSQIPAAPKKATVEAVSATKHAISDEDDEDEDENTDDNLEVHAGPAVRRMARELGVDLALIQGSGPKSRIIKEDVQSFVKSRLSQTATQASVAGLPTAPVVDFAKFGPISLQPLSRIKKVSGKNLHRNWLLVPHITQFNDADITELEAFRVSQKGLTEKQGIKLTPLVFIMKAVAASLKAFPQFNASLDAQGENLILKNYFHIGVAVDTPDGLVVPVIRDVDQKGLFQLAKELSVVSEKARNKQLTANDMQGGCFSISSLGGIGGTAFTPIVNVPEVAILGVSKSSYKPVYENGNFVPRLMLPLSLSYDHRVIDGADGARFIMHLSTILSDIRNLLL